MFSYESRSPDSVLPFSPVHRARKFSQVRGQRLVNSSNTTRCGRDWPAGTELGERRSKGGHGFNPRTKGDVKVAVCVFMSIDVRAVSLVGHPCVQHVVGLAGNIKLPLHPSNQLWCAPDVDGIIRKHDWRDAVLSRVSAKVL